MLFFFHSSFAEITTGYTESFETGVLPVGWTTSNSGPWVIDNTKASDGVYSIRSGTVTSGFARSSIEFTDVFNGGHLLVFDVFYTPSPSANNFRVTLDNKEKIFLFERDATTVWRTFSIHIPAGQHTVLFENLIRSNSDSVAWIDNIRFKDTAAFATMAGNLLIAAGGDGDAGILYEYDGNGQLVWEVPWVPLGSDRRMIDVVYTGQKQIAVTRQVDSVIVPGSPNKLITYLDMLDPQTLNISSLSMEPARQLCCGSENGGLAVLDNRLYTASWDSNDQGGIVTRDLGASNTQSYNATQAYRHVSVGLDNLLYALYARSATIDVFNPTTMVIQNVIQLPTTGNKSYQAVTANAAGELFVVVNSGSIEKISAKIGGGYTADARITSGRPESFTDIDIDNTGRVVAAGSRSAVMITDANFSFSTEFYAAGSQYGSGAKIGLIKNSIVDSDNDGMPDSWESLHAGLDPTVDDASGDLDSDLLLNLEEYVAQTDPNNPDTDTDQLDDGPEVHVHKTSPTDADSDDDGLLDGAEIVNGTLPLVEDSDGDGLLDGVEVNTYLTDPNSPDSDSDGLTDAEEINIFGTDPNSADSDVDKMPDKWELDNGLDPNSATDAILDPDSDGLSNVEEFTAGTNITKPDTDGDNLNDGDEVKMYRTDPLLLDTDLDTINDGLEILAGLNPLDGTDAALDFDGDGLTNIAELALGTDPTKTDTDLDGLTDGYEVSPQNTNPTNPIKADSDNDNLTDGAEVNTHKTDPNKADSDTDGLSDGEEINTHFTNPLQADSDNDGLSDGEEVNKYFTLPNDRDTDNDGLSDGTEVAAGLDPLVANTTTLDDSDSDGMPDVWETTYGFNPNDNTDAMLDTDGDGVSNLNEFLAGSVPNDTDTDNDGMLNAWEIIHGLNHEDGVDASQDNDSDNLDNLAEFQAGTDPNNSDSDEDGMPDGWELTNGLNPLLNTDASLDPDGDGRANLQEFADNTDPNVADLASKTPTNSSSPDNGGGALGPIYLLLFTLYGFVRVRRRVQPRLIG